MKIRDLVSMIKGNTERVGRVGIDFFDYDVYIEQCSEEDKVNKRYDGWDSVIDSEEWEYFKSAGFCNINDSKKIVTINVNY